MNRILIVTFVLVGFFCVPLFCQESSFAVGLGMNFYNYQSDEMYLSIGMSYLREIGDDFVLRIGTGFELTTAPKFIIPLLCGLNFYFPLHEKFEFFLGFGLTPIFKIGPSSDEETDGSARFRFYMGPYLNGGVRVMVHKFMKLYVELEQDLLIGPPDWINNATRVHGGISFRLPSE
ncbi:MAG TPA: hypothetical protein VMX75_13730 [Spirochaetia bacterium]|nr:hypothetical protein [Spirochaetia bacterium]